MAADASLQFVRRVEGQGRPGMRSHPNSLVLPYLLRDLPGYEHGDSTNGAFIFRVWETKLRVIASDGGGWDHVSVSLADRCPTWEEMCAIKRKFFMPEECVVQFHPPESEYVNCHPNVLHLWRKQGAVVELPPRSFV